MVNWILLIVAIIWSIAMIYYAIITYKLYRKLGWFNHKSFIFGYITYILSLVSFGIIIWGNSFKLLSFNGFVIFMAMGILFFVIFMAMGILFFVVYMGFNVIQKRDLNIKHQKIRKKLKEKKLKIP